MALPIFPILLILGLGAAAAASSGGSSSRRRRGGGASNGTSGGGEEVPPPSSEELPPWEDWGISDAIVPMTAEEEEALVSWQDAVSFIQGASGTLALRETLAFIEARPDDFADFVVGEPYKQSGKWQPGRIKKIPISEDAKGRLAERIGSVASEKAAAAMINLGDASSLEANFQALRRAYTREIWEDPRVVEALSRYPEARQGLAARVGARLTQGLRDFLEGPPPQPAA